MSEPSIPTAHLLRDPTLAALQRSDTHAVFVLSDLGTILMWSAGARTLSGWSAEQAVGKPFSFWIADGDADMLRTWVDQLSHRDWIDLKTERAFADGTRRAVRSSLGALRDGSRLVGLLDIARDFPFDTDPRATALRDPRAHDALMHAQKLESLGVMAGGIAHDFNNLLTAMRDLPMDNPSRRRVQDIHDAARRAAHLTRQLLAYSGKAKFEVRPLDLSAHVQEISHLMQACISKKSDLRLELTPDMPAVQADVAQLQQVVMNLVVNASEAIGEQGSGSIIVSTGVTTMTSDMCRRLIGGARLASGDYAFLRVSDTGCGIEPSVCERIFDPFFTTKMQGRGLGLAAVLGIMRAHGGGLDLETTPGSGTCFTAFFPTVSAPAEQTSRTGVHRFRGAGRVLVVDDESCVRSVAKSILTELGFDVAEAENGAEAVRMVAEEPDAFLAVLLDVAMPVMGGAEAFERLRSIRSDLTVIMTSGYSESATMESLAAGKPSGFLSKPYSAAQFAEVILGTLGALSAQKEAGA
jgi:PAS domain S-box-containing protein